MKNTSKTFIFLILAATILSCDSNYSSSDEDSSIGDYEYSVSGVDENGNYVEGDVEVSQDGGSGTVSDEYGNEKEVDVEWTGNGELEGTDEDGETYDLEVE